MTNSNIVMLITLSLLVTLGAVCNAAIPTWSPTSCGKSKYPDAGEMDLPTGFIVGGEDTRPNEFPWQVSLRDKTRNYRHFCGGSIINENWIVTAAHCAGRLAENTAIVAGDWIRSASSDVRQIIDVSLIKIHENYVASNPPAGRRNPENDIALFKLATPITFSENVQPVCAPDSSVDYTNRKVLTSGWGTLTPGGVSPDTLQYVTLNITTDAYCSDLYLNPPRNFTFTVDMICASDNVGTTERDSCQGDSGGPLVSKEADGTFRLVGVVSWGQGCASGYPGVYAETAYFNDWITNFISDN